MKTNMFKRLLRSPAAALNKRTLLRETKHLTPRLREDAGLPPAFD